MRRKTSINSLFQFITKFSEEHRDQKEYRQRSIYWLRQMKLIRQKEEKKEITREEADLLRSRLVAAKEWLASRDYLTGLYNRKELDRQFEKAFFHNQRTKEPLSFLLIDIDGLKKENDRFGHQAGDKVLQKTAKVIKENIRKEDMAGRWGGDEFGIICPNVDASEGEQVAKRILEAVRQHPLGKGKITVSLGIGEIRSETEKNLKDYFAEIDKSLYQAKREGGNKVIKV